MDILEREKCACATKAELRVLLLGLMLLQLEGDRSESVDMPYTETPDTGL
jgi:hypothetical protein